MRRRLAVAAAICIVLFCAKHYYRDTVAARLPVITSAPCDFLPYYQGAQHILHGESPYLADGYIYPPLLAFALTPLATLDYLTARRVWFVISQLFLIASALLLWRRFGRDWVSACWIAFVWAYGGAAGEALAVGQVGPMLLFLVVLALTCRQATRGAAVAAGFALKLFPGLLGVALLLRRERRALAGSIGTAAAALVLPWIAVACFRHGPGGLAKSSAWTGTPAITSWSIPSVALRLIDPAGASYLLPRNWMLGTNLEHFHLSPPLAVAGLAVSLFILMAGLFALWCAVGSRIREEQVPWTMAALVTLALLASPVCWSHYQVLEYPVVAMLLISAWRKRQWGQTLAVIGLAAVVYPIPIYVLGWVSHHWTARSMNELYFWTTVPALASLSLFAMSIRRAAQAALPRGRHLHTAQLVTPRWTTSSATVKQDRLETVNTRKADLQVSSGDTKIKPVSAN